MAASRTRFSPLRDSISLLAYAQVATHAETRKLPRFDHRALFITPSGRNRKRAEPTPVGTLFCFTAAGPSVLLRMNSPAVGGTATRLGCQSHTSGRHRFPALGAR